MRLVARPIREDEPDPLAGWEHEPSFLCDLAGQTTLRIAVPMWGGPVFPTAHHFFHPYMADGNRSVYALSQYKTDKKVERALSTRA